MVEEAASHLPAIAGIGPSYYLELPAIAAGCLSGGLHAVRKGFDAVGILAQQAIASHLPLASIVAVGLVIILRLLAQRHRWHGPMPRSA